MEERVHEETFSTGLEEDGGVPEPGDMVEGGVHGRWRMAFQEAEGFHGMEHG
jgi:hypothetical protein